MTGFRVWRGVLGERMREDDSRCCSAATVADRSGARRRMVKRTGRPAVYIVVGMARRTTVQCHCRCGYSRSLRPRPRPRRPIAYRLPSASHPNAPRPVFRAIVKAVRRPREPTPLTPPPPPQPSRNQIRVALDAEKPTLNARSIASDPSTTAPVFCARVVQVIFFTPTGYSVLRRSIYHDKRLHGIRHFQT